MRVEASNAKTSHSRPKRRAIKHTKRKIQQVIDTEPSRPDAASRGVRGTVPSEPMLLRVCNRAMVSRGDFFRVVLETSGAEKNCDGEDEAMTQLMRVSPGATPADRRAGQGSYRVSRCDCEQKLQDFR